MAWVTSHTWVTSEYVSGAKLNTNIRDNTKLLFSRPGASITTVASGIPFDSSNTLAQVSAAPTILWDTDAMTSDQFQLAVNTAGVYAVLANGEWDADSGGTFRRVSITWNGDRHTTHCIQTNGSSSTLDQNVTGRIKAAAGDIFAVSASQNSGDTINLSPLTAGHEMFSAVWCGAG